MSDRKSFLGFNTLILHMYTQEHNKKNGLKYGNGTDSKELLLRYKLRKVSHWTWQAGSMLLRSKSKEPSDSAKCNWDKILIM